MKKLYIKGLIMMMFAGAVLSGCSSNVTTDEPVVEVQAAVGGEVEDDATEENIMEKIEITKVSDGAEASLNDLCKKLETYAEYNIQVSDEQILSELFKEEYEGMELKEHVVAATDDSNSEGGRYDAVDTMTVHLDMGNPLGILAGTIDKTVQYKRETETGNWIKISDSCDKWNLNHKKLGGTVWKRENADVTEYIRLSSTPEFFHTNVDPKVKSSEEVAFDTSILSARVNEKDGEVSFDRLTIFSGTVTDTGIITLNLTLVDGSEEVLVLNDYEKIDKADCPISDDEFYELLRTDAVAINAY